MVINGNVSAVGKRISGTINSNGYVEGSVEKAENIFVKELYFENRYNFPNIGKPNMIYIATDEKASYIFDTAQNVYHCIGRDYNEITAIQCGLKEE